MHFGTTKDALLFLLLIDFCISFFIFCCVACIGCSV
jgi:hypothetical protein